MNIQGERLRIVIVLIFILCMPIPVLADTSGFDRVVADPADSLIYPQQIAVEPDSKFIILDTISNSAHVKIYSESGEFMSGLVPAGAGDDSAKFDLGQTMWSGKNMLAIDENGILYIFDNEDGWPIVKSISQSGTFQNGVTIGVPVPDDAYGSIAVDDGRIYVEYNDEILVRELPLKSGFERFTGKPGETIDNWDVCGGLFIALSGEEITILNRDAIPVGNISLTELLSEFTAFDIYDISISLDGYIALAGLALEKSGAEKPFLALTNRFGKTRKIIRTEMYVTSIDWSKSGSLYALFVGDKDAEAVIYDKSLSPMRKMKMAINQPTLSHPSRIAISNDGAVWVDDQSDPSSIENPYKLLDSTCLYLKRFQGSSYSEFKIDELGKNRFASFFLGYNGENVTLSGIKTDSNGLPISTPSYDVSLNQGNFEIYPHEDTAYLTLAYLNESGEGIFLDPNEGLLMSGTYEMVRDKDPKCIIFKGISEEGIPSIFPLDNRMAVGEIQESPEEGVSTIRNIDLKSGKSVDTWKSCEYADLKVLYSCGDGTAVVYWFSRGLLRIDENFKIVEWIGVGDETVYNFTHGGFRNGKHYLLDSRYNLVYAFDDSSWEKIKRVMIGEVRQAASDLRSWIAVFYSLKRVFPEKLHDVVDAGLTDEKSMAETLKYFISESPIYYSSGKYDYSLILWGKDEDNTIFTVNASGMEKH